MESTALSYSIPMLNRRALLSGAAGLPLMAAGPPRKNIAAVLTVYTRNSHADVIAGRLLEGYEYNGERRTPGVRIVSLYVDQTPAGDLSAGMAAKHGVPIHRTVKEALTRGGGGLSVDGVLLVGEHGDYPVNAKGQKLYPRYELFRQVVDVFRASGRAVPVFNDKHLSVEWEKARWMYDQSRALQFPFLAGSSLPLAWRKPPVELDYGAAADRAVCCFYGGKESYGFHALEALQCLVERRKGGETGIAAVECLEGEGVWQWTGANPWAGRLLEAALAMIPDRASGAPRGNVPKPVAFLLDYRDGLRAAVYILEGHIRSCGLALSAVGRPEPLATQVWLQPGRPFGHFANLCYYIEQLMITSKAPYPVERTLLTTGALAAAMDSSYQKNRRLETPHLAVSYRAPRESLFARGPAPPLEDPPR